MLAGLVLVAMVGANALAGDGVYSRQYSVDAVQFKATDFGDAVSMTVCSLHSLEPGAPDLPLQLYRLVVSAEEDVQAVSVGVADFECLEGNFQIAPVHPPIPMNGTVDFKPAEPDAAIYGSDEPFPANPVELVADEFLGGYHIVTLRICPLRYYPLSGKLELAKNLEFSLATIPSAECHFAPARRSEASMVWADETIASFVDNDEDVARFAPPTTMEPVALGPDSMVARPWPALEGPPVDFVIITSNALVPSFQPLADWKQQRGWITVIKTVSQIEAQYPGRDTAERIRNFIIDAGEQWGTLFFLLGGDTNVVPARFGMWDSYGSNWGPTDLYFATAEGDWDANGNGIFGEPDDQVDDSVDFHVGRAPVENVTEADVFVQKVLNYELSPVLGFVETSLLMGASIGSGNDTWGQSCKETIKGYLPLFFDVWRLYNILWVGDELLTRTNAIARLNQGYHYINHADHSSPSCMGTGYTHGGGVLSREDASALTNGWEQGLIFSLGCSPNAFDYDSISERFINNPNGGTVAYMGNTRTGWSSQTPQDIAFFREVFQNGVLRLGHTFSIARSELGGYYRRNQNLLGDPTMYLWTENPCPMTATHPAALLTGPTDFTVRVLTPWLHPVEDAQVCLYKTGEIYAVGFTAVDGRVTLPVYCQTGGVLNITATKVNYLPYQAAIPAGPPIWGRIYWPNGDPASHVNMTCTSLRCSGQWTTTTDAAGYYAFEVPADSYEVRATRRVNCTTYRANVCPVTFNGSIPLERNLTIQPNGMLIPCPWIACEEEELERDGGTGEDDDDVRSNLFGTVYWDCGIPNEVAPFVNVTAKLICSSQRYTMESNSQGWYGFNVVPGRYNMTATIRVNGVTYTAVACNVLVSDPLPTLVNFVVTSGGSPIACKDCPSTDN